MEVIKPKMERVDGTPFTVLEVEDGATIVVGSQLATGKIYKDFAAAKRDINKVNWDLVYSFIAAVKSLEKKGGKDEMVEGN